MAPGRLPVSLPLLPLPRLSPSRYASLRACALREAWAAARTPALLPMSPAARMGSVAHRLIEEAGKGQLGVGNRVTIESRWDELVGEAEAEARQSWLDRHLVPLKASVPDFEVRRLRAVQRALELSLARGGPASGSGRPPTTWHEKWLETPDGRVGGYIDEIVESDRRPVLRDYKSGHILDGDPSDANGGVREAYRLQLQLYAAIFARATGVWPVRLEVVPLQGVPREISFSPEECEALLAEALERLAGVNATIAAGSGGSALARPSAETCRFCLYRPACDSYQAPHGLETSEANWPDDLWGVVREKRVLGNGKVFLAVERRNAPGQLAFVRGLNPSGERHPALSEIATGDAVAVFGLARSGGGASYTETRWTVLYRVLG